jgi:hypothetical protein
MNCSGEDVLHAWIVALARPLLEFVVQTFGVARRELLARVDP